MRHWLCLLKDITNCLICLILKIHDPMPDLTSTTYAYAIRVDELDPTVRVGLLALLAACCTAYLVVRETVAHENPHYHVFCQSGEKIKPFRNKFRTHLPQVLGNKSYSLKQCEDDFEPYLRYLCKGE